MTMLALARTIIGGKSLYTGVEAGVYKDGRNESGTQPSLLLYHPRHCHDPTVNCLMALLRAVRAWHQTLTDQQYACSHFAST